jgi:D-cysteine desulfhydrase
VHEAPRLADALRLRGRLLVKRDDLTGFAVAGNKARPLELLVASARDAEADVLVTGGTPGSNYCQAAAAAAAVAGMTCVLVYAGFPTPRTHPNLLAARHWGARIEWTRDPDRASVDTTIEAVAADLVRHGQRPFTTPRGGTTPLGAVGFHLAALELAAQVEGPAVVVLATGSGGTTAGLVSGTVALDRRFEIHGASVSRAPEETRDRVLVTARACSELLSTPQPEARDIRLVDARGPGHGVESPGGAKAAQLALTTTGLVLDPVYTAKALAALPDILGDRRADPDLTTIFWHTGGLLDAVSGWETR